MCIRAESFSDQEHLVRLYALGKLDAKAFSIACFLAAKAGAKGDNLKLYGLPPGESSSGNYSRRLKKVLPQQVSAPELDLVEIPVNIRGRRTTKLVPVAPIHECMEAESRETSDMNVEKSDDNDWCDSFEGHPHRHRADGKPVHPIALYLDGIKYTRSIGPGRADSLVGITAYNLKTSQRHLIAVVSKREMCGYDSLWPILNHIKWSLSAATEGRRPTKRWDDSPWPKKSAYYDEQGTELGSRYLLCQIKADWSEQCSAMGFPTWSSVHAPCFLCACTKSTMYRFDAVTLVDDGWGKKATTYEAECSRHEMRITVATEDDRMMILTEGGLQTHKKKKLSGRVLKHDVGKFGLCAGDRLEPSQHLQHSGVFDTKEVPFEAVFWRAKTDAKGRSLSWVTRRCPLFCPELGTTPDTVLHLDTLHCVYLGVFSTFTYYVLREALDVDVYGIGGPKETREPATLERLLND